MDRVIDGMKIIYKKEKKSRRNYRTLWYTIIDRERRCCTINNDRDRAIRDEACEAIAERSKAKFPLFISLLSQSLHPLVQALNDQLNLKAHP